MMVFTPGALKPPLRASKSAVGRAQNSKYEGRLRQARKSGSTASSMAASGRWRAHFQYQMSAATIPSPSSTE